MNYSNKEHFEMLINEKAKYLARHIELFNETNGGAKERAALICLGELKDIIKCKFSLSMNKEDIYKTAELFYKFGINYPNKLELNTKLEVIAVDYVFQFEEMTDKEFREASFALLKGSEDSLYKEFLNVFESKDAKAAFKNLMENKWYELNSDSSWYDTENNQSFTGYWSIYAMALYKFLKMNDPVKYVYNI